MEFTFFLLPAVILVIMANLVVVIIINLLFTGKEKIKFNTIYKEEVVRKILNNFYDKLEYFPQKEMPEYIYEEPEYNEYYDNYESDDYFEAQINNKYGIQTAEVLTQEEQEYEDSNGETQTREITIFHGLFTKIEIDKSINSQLKIMQNGQIHKNDRLEMDSSEFEKYFDVKASNPIIGMQLLTADVMEELIEFENKTKMKYDICINNNKLYLRFHCGDMFEPTKIKNEALNKAEIQKYFYMVNFTYNLSNKLITLINETEI